MRKRKPIEKLKRATFVLSDDYHTLTLVNVLMKVALVDTGMTRNIYQGEIAKAWQQLPDEHKKLQVVGVLFADRTKMYDGRIEWLDELGVVENRHDVHDLQQAFAFAANAKAG
jgi:hypothetical protein